MVRLSKREPLQYLRESLDKLEAGVNTVAARKMLESERLAPALAGMQGVSLGLRHVFGTALAGLHEGLDVPSRTEVAALAAALRRVEDKLAMLLPSAPCIGPRPARTRRAPESPEALPALVTAAVPDGGAMRTGRAGRGNGSITVTASPAAAPRSGPRTKARADLRPLLTSEA